MGRNRLVLTAEQLAERQERYWGAARNKARRERYSTDVTYRSDVIQQVRQTYRSKREETGAQVRDDDCRYMLPHLSTIAKVRKVDINGVACEALTLSVEEMATVLMRNTQALYRWIKLDMFPEPVFKALNSLKRIQSVYLLSEAVALINVIGEHQSHAQYYREIHTETRNSVFAAIRSIREPLGAWNNERNNSQSHSAAA